MNATPDRPTRSLAIMQVIASIDPAWGGPSTGAYSLCRGLNHTNASARIFTADYPVSTETVSEEYATVCAASHPYAVENSFQLISRLWKECKNFDLVHIHGSYRMPPAYAYVIARLRRKAYGCQLHGALEPYQRDTSKIAKRIFDHVIGNAMYQRAIYVMAASESEKANASDRINSSKIFVNPLGGELVEPKPVAALLPALANLPRESVYVFLGRLARKKRPDLLLEAWAQAGLKQPAHLVIAGPDDDWSRKRLAELSTSLGTTSTVTFTGPLNKNEKSWLLAHAGTFVLPSENENYGIAVAEAMMAGCHVITTEQVAASNNLALADAGTILPWPDLQLLASELLRVHTDAAAMGQSGRRAQEFAVAELTWRATANRLLDFAAPRIPVR